MKKLLVMAAVIVFAFEIGAADTATKVDSKTIEITKQAVTPAPVKVKYERAFIEEQIVQITKQRDEMIAAKQKELDECKAILAEMEKLGIKSEGK